MGLDIYFHLYKKTRERNEGEEMYEYYADLAKEADNKICSEAKSAIKRYINEHKNAKSVNVNALCYELKRYFPFNFQLVKLQEAKTIKDIKEWAASINWDYVYKKENAYFRKVNCIYGYFMDRLENEICEVTKEDVLDIIKKATKILTEKDENLASELLPTQGGFFFGSTEYDELYYDDMITILSEFGKLLNDWEDDDICFVRMSW